MTILHTIDWAENIFRVAMIAGGVTIIVFSFLCVVLYCIAIIRDFITEGPER